MSLDVQNSLIQAIQIMAGEKLKNVNFTKSYTGVVRSVNGSTATVEILGTNSECIIPMNLASYIDKDDVVIVQDINNSNAQKIIQGVIASTQQWMFHIYDPVEDKIVSSVLQLWDEDTGRPVDIVFEME